MRDAPLEQTDTAAIRFDDQPAERVPVSVDKDGGVLAVRANLPRLAKQVGNARDVRFEIELKGGSRRTVRFLTYGFEEAIAPVRDACGWK